MGVLKVLLRSSRQWWAEFDLQEVSNMKWIRNWFQKRREVRTQKSAEFLAGKIINGEWK